MQNNVLVKVYHQDFMYSNSGPISEHYRECWTWIIFQSTRLNIQSRKSTSNYFFRTSYLYLGLLVRYRGSATWPKLRLCQKKLWIQWVEQERSLFDYRSIRCLDFHVK
jgi:hypothetical protein